MFRRLMTMAVLCVAGFSQGQEDGEALAKALSDGREALEVMDFGGGEALVSRRFQLGETKIEHDGNVFDGIRLVAPGKTSGKDFIWYFNIPEGWAHWYIVPLGGEMKQGFRSWLTPDRLYANFDKAGEEGRFRVLQTLDGRYFDAGAEYVLWFRRVEDGVKGEMRVRAAFSERVEDWDRDGLEEALGLRSSPAADQVAELDSRGGRILLDGELFEKGYAEDRIDSLFFSMRRQKDMAGGFSIRIETSTPPCRKSPLLAEIIDKYGEADFIVSSAEEAAGNGDSDEGGEPVVTHYYDYFGLEVSENESSPKVRRVVAQANDFSTLRPMEDSRATFGSLRFRNLIVMHLDGDEVGRIYGFDEGGRKPDVVKLPRPGVYSHGLDTLKHLGAGSWEWRSEAVKGIPSYIKRYSENRLNGLSEMFHETRKGGVKFSLPYKDGLLHGRVTEYDEGGEILREMEYREGELVE